MTEPIAYFNGEFVPISQARVWAFDLGLVQGAAVTEMIRTFAHQPFHLDEHLERLFRSLRAVGFPMELSLDQVRSLTLDVLSHNEKLVLEAHDLGIVLFVTAGLNVTYVGLAGLEECRRPTVCIHTFPLPFELWAAKFETGQHLVTPSIRHIPASSLDPKIKSRSRLHWYLADQQAKLADPHAMALALDHEGNVTETSTGNFFLVSGGAIHTPGERSSLGGVSQLVVEQLAQQLGIPYQPADIQMYDVFNAEEAFTSSTPYCLLPVTRFNGRPIGGGRPGQVFARLMDAWKDLVGLDIIAQMRTGAADRMGPKTP
jgi:branched-subunit amino acid aminotransferase/4-amino-4-deoxychorismate lyase